MNPKKLPSKTQVSDKKIASGEFIIRKLVIVLNKKQVEFISSSKKHLIRKLPCHEARTVKKNERKVN